VGAEKVGALGVEGARDWVVDSVDRGHAIAGARCSARLTVRGASWGVDSLLSKLFEGDDSSVYARMAARGDWLISDEDFADCYSAGMGRPSIPPSLLMRTVLLQVRDDLSDREAARRAAKGPGLEAGLGLGGRRGAVPPHHAVGVP
jgi:hypothetical protein